MQNKSKLGARPQLDARLPFSLAVIIGAIARAALVALAYANDPTSDLALYSALLLAAYLAFCGAMLVTYFWQLHRQRELQAAADELNTDVYDVFKYVIDLPYTVVDAKGNVKVINRALQDILGIRSPICNMPLSSFCSIAMPDIIRSVSEPYEVRHARALDANGEIVPGAHGFHIRMGDRRYELFAHAMRLRGQDYYMISFHDVTDYLELREKMERESPVVA